MCGRASLPNDVSELKQDLRIEWDKLGDYKPRWNAAPTTDLPVVTSSEIGRALELMRWGLIPYWSKARPKPPPINAKSETVAKLPMFRDAYRRRRCICPSTSSSSGRRSGA